MKKRIQSWLNANRLQLPLHNLDSDSITNVPQTDTSVKRKNSYKDTDTRDLTPEQQALLAGLMAQGRADAKMGLYNRVFIDANKISTVFGRSGLRRYITEQVTKGNLVRVKKGSIQTSESTSPINADYGKNASGNSILNNEELVKRQNSYKDTDTRETHKAKRAI